MHVVLSADGGFVRPLAVTLASLARTASQSTTIHVIADEIPAADKKRLETCTAPRPIHWVEPEVDHYSGLDLPEGMSRPSLFRLSLGDLLPDVGRVLYLDADLIVCGELGELNATELEGDLAGAVADAAVRVFGSPLGPPWVEFGVPAGTPYFNAGVLLLDVDQMRRDDVAGRAVELLRHHMVPYADQCALNLLSVGRWKALHPKWNLQTGHLEGSAEYSSVHDAVAVAEATHDPRVVHFTANWAKPWNPATTDRHPWAARWYEILDSTPYAGWRPATQPGASRAQMRSRVGSLHSNLRRTTRLAAGRAAGALGSPDSISHRTREVARRVGAASGGRVAGGPFLGTTIADPPDSLPETVLPSHVLGTYGAELHHHIENLLAAEPNDVVLVGTADPTWPTGFSIRSPRTRVRVVEADDRRWHVCAAIAAHNPAARVERTKLSDLRDSDLASSVWIVDSRRAHHELAALDLTAASQILAVRYDHHDPTFTPTLAAACHESHRVELLDRSTRSPAAIPVLSRSSDEDRWLAMCEFDNTGFLVLTRRD